MSTQLVGYSDTFAIYSVANSGTGPSLLAAMHIKNRHTGQIVYSKPLHASGFECVSHVNQWALELGQLWCRDRPPAA